MKYIRVPLSTLVRTGRIVTCFRADCPPDHCAAPERHDFYELVYARRGCVVACTEEGNRPLLPGSAILHAPDVVHSLHGNGHDACDFFIITFESTSPVLAAVSGRVLTLPPHLRTLPDLLLEERRRSFDGGFMPLSPRSDAPAGGQQMIRLYLEQILIALIRVAEETGTEHGIFTTADALERQLAADVAAYLSAHLDSRVTLSDLCAVFHYGKSRLCAAFRRVHGDSVMHWYLSARIGAACRALREGEEDIAAIAAQLQFDCPQYFSRVFRQYTGLCPRDYRAACRSGEGVPRQSAQNNPPQTGQRVKNPHSD